MCGIAGILAVTGSPAINADLLRAMNGRLAHRGPDGSGCHVEPDVGLAHRRLSIIDLETGEQPMFNEDGSVCVVFNGEIYNFQGLADELTALGHRFHTRSDTEVIVHAWEEWGTACVDRFNGMFAFAVWDRNRRTLFLARDRLGIKPLYYAQLPGGHLVFASELKALAEHPGFPRQIDPTAVEDYFTFGYIPEPKTIYAGVYKLLPGWWLLQDLKSGQQRSSAYWDISHDRQGEIPSDPADLQAELIDRLARAVGMELISDVPLGAFLSGGVDSSAVVAMMARTAKGRVKTCSIAVDEPAFDESPYARQVAALLGTDHAESTVRVDDLSLMDRLVDVYDEPYADSSAIPTYRLCAATRHHVKVALSGDGGDENFAGYRRYRMFSAGEKVRAVLPAAIRQPLFGFLGRWYPKLDWAPRVFRGKSTFQSLARDSAGAYLHAVAITTDELRNSLYSDSLQSELGAYRAREVFDRYLRGREFPDTLTMAQYLDFKTYIPGDILTKVDRASMAHGLEVRVPLLDHEFVDWVARIPSALKLRGGEGKWIFKKSLEPVLPASILYRRKMGFAVPLNRWFRGPLANEVRALGASESLLATGFFRPEALQRIVSLHLSGRRDHSAVLWALLMFEGFLRRHIEA
ncbi:MAG: amidotransferase 1, exosortase A system-associated [Gammaproteobacteria bacterium]|nr:amidotransferase 1, exosortase A system-associated [Gammaproteobacteria bacterium]